MRSTTLSFLIVLGAALLVAPPLGGCVSREPGWGKPTTLDFHLNKDVAIPERPVVIFLCDGLSKKLFEQMLDAGELPHIKHYLVDRGVRVRSAVVSTPTITYAGLATYATGRLPGHHGILGNKWFDPYLMVSQDYTEIDTMSLVDDDIRGQTIYELLDREKSAVVLSQINRGCTNFYENWYVAGIAWFCGAYRNVDMSTTARLQNIAEQANRDKRWPDLVTLYYPSTDAVAHLHGIASPEYREMFTVTDNEIGDACKAFEQQGFLDRTLLVLVTDHGMVDTPNHVNLKHLMAEAGLRVYTKKLDDQPSYYQQRAARFEDSDVVVTVDGNRFAKLYFRIPGFAWSHRPTLDELRHYPLRTAAGPLPDRRKSWSEPPRSDLVTLDLIDTCLKMPATDMAAWADRALPEPHVHIFTTNGHGLITRRESNGHKEYSYTVAEGRDPLGYSDQPKAKSLLDGQFHTSAQWLDATIGTPCPDYIVQLTEMFDSSRAGDLALFAKPGWDFRLGNTGGHGGLSPAEILTPMIFAGGGLPRGQSIPYARTVCLVPTVIDYVRGQKEPTLFRDFDGDSLLDILRAAGQNDTSQKPLP
jgi:arylsulfatase A-like enzyme